MTWKLVGKLHKRNSFSGYPIESLHRDLKELAPHSDISDYGVTRKTNKFLQKKLEEYARKKTGKWSTAKWRKMAVAMEMLQYSPADLPDDSDYEDFHVYVREDRIDE